MAKPPRSVGLILCRRLEMDTERVEISLRGLFLALRFATWPAIAPPFTAFAALQGGQGEGTIEVVVTQLETERNVHRLQRWIGFADPSGLLHLELVLRHCVFPAPGRYGFTLSFDGQDLTRRLLDVYDEGGNE